MKYTVLTIVGSVLLLTGCGQVKEFSANQTVREPVDEPANDFTAEEIKQIQFEAKMLAENGEPSSEELLDATEPMGPQVTFEELSKTAARDEKGNIILTAQMRYLFPGCDKAESGFSVPNTFVKYSNSAKGIEFNVPYNQNWHFCGYRLAPYDTVKKESSPYLEYDSIEFGPLKLAPESGSNLIRKYYLTFKPTSAPEKLIASFNDPLIKYKQMKIGGLDVVSEYNPPPTTEGMGCSSLLYYVFGQKATYQFRGYCVETEIGDQKYSADEFSKELEQIIKTVKLI